MEWMDGARRFGGLLWVTGGLIFQIVCALVLGVSFGPVTWTVGFAVVLLALVSAAGRPDSVSTWLLGWLMTVLLALDFAGAVADRFGAFGSPGSAGVSWGSWSTFTDYTATLVPWLPSSLVPIAAVAATVAEVVLAVWLVSGWHRRWAGKAVAGLLTVYTVTMTFTVGAAEIATYAVPMLVGGALLASAVAAPRPAAAGGNRPTRIHGGQAGLEDSQAIAYRQL